MFATAVYYNNATNEDEDDDVDDKSFLLQLQRISTKQRLYEHDNLDNLNTKKLIYLYNYYIWKCLYIKLFLNMKVPFR